MPAREFLLPDLGEGLDEAEVVAWRVSQGDTVELNQTLVEVNTAKALVEIPSPWEGVVDKLHAAEGDVVKVGQPLVTIQVEGAEEPEARPKRRAMLVGYGVEEEEEKEQGPPPARVPAAARGDGRAAPVPASPPVRRLAKEMGVELAAVAGTGPGGRVTREDVLAAASGAGPALEPGDERIPVRGVRRLTAEKMARSAREIPHVTTFLTVDAINLEAFRQELQQETGSRITALPVVVRAFVEVVKEHRALNATFDAEASEIILRGDVNVGIATDTERGLLVPVVRHADGLGIVELAGEIARLVRAAREGRSSPQELSGGTVTVTNVGSFGAEYGTPRSRGAAGAGGRRHGRGPARGHALPVVRPPRPGRGRGGAGHACPGGDAGEPVPVGLAPPLAGAAAA
ncbi:MAG: 2-oxo acid dehydrogenase subunit E2 [Actinobacteria bacterium]|nr:MAG: 2-oxo acid dehydrogenase subunit E2 [Actinomycetota bacterium]